ncbi:hypothetical protein MtrunA17_Chr3g0080811 [Medicago truncatula]|uniref:Transmembrane protein n=1 Tax=Medicago truncatula TaxID=3880 RepID=A0A396ILJ8_MEDTR|nr:hypothetical protein MtrunA17_Chr3g0080811 [Medicago truncatula]
MVLRFLLLMMVLCCLVLRIGFGCCCWWWWWWCWGLRMKRRNGRRKRRRLHRRYCCFCVWVFSCLTFFRFCFLHFGSVVLFPRGSSETISISFILLIVSCIENDFRLVFVYKMRITFDWCLSSIFIKI